MEGEITAERGAPPATATVPGEGGEAGAGAARDQILIVMNPHSGKKKTGERATALREEVARQPGRYVLREVVKGSDIGAAVERAVADGFRTIVAAGGDGTICAVASALVGSRCRMGVIPLGTFNYFARGLSIPEDVPGALRVLAEEEPRPYDVGEVNGQVFLNNASLGAYAKVLESRERIYRRFGRSRLAAYYSVLVALASFRARLSVTLTVDGETHRLKTPLIFVANNPYQLDLFRLDGADLIRQGQMVVLVAPDVGRLGLIAFAIRLALRNSTRGRDFRLLAGRDILIETKRRGAVVARDGERGRLKAPFRFRLREGALQLIAPPGIAAPDAA